MSRRKITLDEFARLYEDETGFDLMDRDGRTVEEHVKHNIQWFRDYAEETVRRLESFAERIRKSEK